MTIRRRLAKLESVIRVPVCARCDGHWLGFHFSSPTPEDFTERTDPETGEVFPPVMPLECPDCGRVIPKHYYMGSRADFDRFRRRVR